jgi:hypothetical protein
MMRSVTYGKTWGYSPPLFTEKLMKHLLKMGTLPENEFKTVQV